MDLDLTEINDKTVHAEFLTWPLGSHAVASKAIWYSTTDLHSRPPYYPEINNYQSHAMGQTEV